MVRGCTLGAIVVSHGIRYKSGDMSLRTGVCSDGMDHGIVSHERLSPTLFGAVTFGTDIEECVRMLVMKRSAGRSDTESMLRILSRCLFAND